MFKRFRFCKRSDGSSIMLVVIFGYIINVFNITCNYLILKLSNIVFCFVVILELCGGYGRYCGMIIL